MPILERPTVNLNYTDEGSGPPLVFLHGWCDGSPSWRATIEHFSPTNRCLAPDMRGHGASGLPSDHAYFLEALSNDVVALCEVAGVTDPVLVGHSFGGVLAAITASRFPGLARAIVVEDQVLDITGFGAQMRSLGAVVRSPETHMAFRTQLYDSMVSPAMPAESRALIQGLKDATPVAIGPAFWATLFEYTDSELAGVSERGMRALGLQPSLTIESSPQSAYHARLAELAPSAQKAVIESGHWIHLERPAEFRSVLGDFIHSL